MDYSKLNLSDSSSHHHYVYQLQDDNSVGSTIKKSIMNVLNGNLDEKQPKQQDFQGLENTVLRNHQKTLLYRMIELENKSIHPDPKFIMNTNMGVVGDVVGAGKSLPVLLMIHNNKLSSVQRDKYFSYNKTCTVSVIEKGYSGPVAAVNNRIHTTILVLPHTLVRQWRSYIDNYVPDLKYKIINKKEHLTMYDDKNKPLYESPQQFLNVPLVIISSTFYSSFITLSTNQNQTYMSQMNYDRVIYDEADSINLPNCYKLKAIFYWFITSSVTNLLRPQSRYWEGKYLDGVKCSGFIKNVFTELEENYFPFYDMIFFKNKDTYIQDSFGLPKPILHRIDCFTPKAVTVLKGILDDKIIQMIQGDDVKGAMEHVGSMNLLKSADDIIKISTNMLLKDLDNRQKEYVYKSSISYYSEDSKAAALKNIQTKIDEIQKKIKLIENRVQNRYCNVCNSDAEIPTITMCCKNVFCLACIQESHKLNPICPFCRSNLGANDIVIQAQVPKEKDIQPTEPNPVPTLPTKMETLISMMKAKPDGKFLVVSLYENSLNDLREKLMIENISGTKLAGNNLVVNKLLSRFKDPASNFNCILLNALNYGSGLNIPEATDIIIYHKLTKELETQVIGRAQRFGRVGALHVHYLQHENEY